MVRVVKLINIIDAFGMNGFSGFVVCDVLLLKKNGSRGLTPKVKIQPRLMCDSRDNREILGTADVISFAQTVACCSRPGAKVTTRKWNNLSL